MRKFYKAFFVLALTAVWFSWSAGQVSAMTIGFGDETGVWPGWESANPGASADTHGVPDITGGSITLDGDTLESVTINFAYWWNGHEWLGSGVPTAHNTNSYKSLFGALRPGDLFLDLGGNATWNYVFSFWDYSSNTKGLSPTDQMSGNRYDVSLPLEGTGYILSNDAWLRSNNSGVNSIPRTGHPVALNPNGYTALEQGLLTGWGTTSITFSGLNIQLGHGTDLTVGFTLNCANDVLRETVAIPTPEPGTIALLGLGLIGLFFGRKRFSRK